jgi:sodium-coupled neutral amino acid transporter 10
MGYAMKSLGIGTGIAMLLIICGMIIYSAYLIIRTGMYLFHEARPIHHIARKSLGKSGPFLWEIASELYLFGALTGYCIIVGEVISSFLLLVDVTLDNRIISVIVAVTLFLPLSSLKSIHSLRITSGFALFSIIFVAFCVTLRGIQYLVEKGVNRDEFKIYTTSLSDFFKVFQNIVFALVFHSNICPVWVEMKDHSQKSIVISSTASVITATIIYGLVGCFGYLTFYEATKGNLIINYGDDMLLLIAKVFFLGVVIFSYPVIAFPLRDGLDKLMFKKQPAPFLRSFAEAGGIVLLSLLLAILVPNVTTVFSITAATAGSTMAFILPSLFYILVVDTTKAKDYVRLEPIFETQVNDSRKKIKWRKILQWKKIPAFLMLVCGFGFGVAGIIPQFVNI